MSNQLYRNNIQRYNYLEHPVENKGDLHVGEADGYGDNLQVGTDGQVLTADSTETLGVKWDNVSAILPNPITNDIDASLVCGDTVQTNTIIDKSGDEVTINNNLVVNDSTNEITASNVVNIENGSGPASYTDGEDSLLRMAGGGSNATSPRASWYTQSQTRPIMQAIARNQIDEYLIFSGYYDGGIKSSDSGGTFHLKRSSADDLRLEAGTASEGSPVAMVSALIIDNTAKIQLPTLSQDDTVSRVLVYDTTDNNRIKWRDSSTLATSLTMSEGTWSPTVTNGSDPWTTLPTFSGGRYTRIGDNVQCRIFAEGGNPDADSNRLTLTLPIARVSGNFTNQNQLIGTWNHYDDGLSGNNANCGVAVAVVGAQTAELNVFFETNITSMDCSTASFWYSLTN